MAVGRLLLLATLLVSCGPGAEGDEPVQPSIPGPAGRAARIHDIRNPASPQKAPDNATVTVSGAVVVAVDNFDETNNGKSAGTIYVADLASKDPYSGISLFNPSFVPGSLRVGPGDALDLKGQYQENNDVPVLFAPKAFLVQLATPVGTLRFEASVPPAVDIDIRDLATYEAGAKWLNMLVRVHSVTLQEGADGQSQSGRISAHLLPEPNPKALCSDPFPKAPQLVNELMDLQPLQLKAGQTVQAITGVVTFFCNFHLAPRTPADVVP